ncbi:MAG: hypothetical protein JSS53_05790 [Proteobacteria bacterium]|nr:hypothetical protein [Pseudomonadota bacterium]
MHEEILNVVIGQIKEKLAQSDYFQDDLAWSETYEEIITCREASNFHEALSFLFRYLIKLLDSQLDANTYNLLEKVIDLIKKESLVYHLDNSLIFLLVYYYGKYHVEATEQMKLSKLDLKYVNEMINVVSDIGYVIKIHLEKEGEINKDDINWEAVWEKYLIVSEYDSEKEFKKIALREYAILIAKLEVWVEVVITAQSYKNIAETDSDRNEICQEIINGHFTQIFDLCVLWNYLFPAKAIKHFLGTEMRGYGINLPEQWQKRVKVLAAKEKTPLEQVNFSETQWYQNIRTLHNKRRNNKRKCPEIKLPFTGLIIQEYEEYRKLLAWNFHEFIRILLDRSKHMTGIDEDTFCFCLIGSAARGEMTDYSDIEYFYCVNKSSVQFKQESFVIALFDKIFKFYVASLGEIFENDFGFSVQGLQCDSVGALNTTHGMDISGALWNCDERKFHFDTQLDIQPGTDEDGITISELEAISMVPFYGSISLYNRLQTTLSEQITKKNDFSHLTLNKAIAYKLFVSKTEGLCREIAIDKRRLTLHQVDIKESYLKPLLFLIKAMAFYEEVLWKMDEESSFSAEFLKRLSDKRAIHPVAAQIIEDYILALTILRCRIHQSHQADNNVFDCKLLSEAENRLLSEVKEKIMDNYLSQYTKIFSPLWFGNINNNNGSKKRVRIVNELLNACSAIQEFHDNLKNTIYKNKRVVPEITKNDKDSIVDIVKAFINEVKVFRMCLLAYADIEVPESAANASESIIPDEVITQLVSGGYIDAEFAEQYNPSVNIFLKFIQQVSGHDISSTQSKLQEFQPECEKLISASEKFTRLLKTLSRQMTDLYAHRFEEFMADFSWQCLLLKFTTLNPTSNPMTPPIKVSSVALGTRFLSEEYIEQCFTDNCFREVGEKESQDWDIIKTTHRVIPITYRNKLMFMMKVNRDDSGADYAAQCLQQAFGGMFVMHTDFMGFELSGNKIGLACVTEGMSGRNLQRILEDKSNLEKELKKINLLHYIRLVIFTLAVGYGDGLPRNIIAIPFRNKESNEEEWLLTCIDMNVIFIKRPLDEKTEVKNVLLYLPQAEEVPLPEDVLEEFCRMNPFRVLKDALEKLKRHYPMTQLFLRGIAKKEIVKSGLEDREEIYPCIRFPEEVIYEFIDNVSLLQQFIRSKLKKEDKRIYVEDLVRVYSSSLGEHCYGPKNTDIPHESPLKTQVGYQPSARSLRVQLESRVKGSDKAPVNSLQEAFDLYIKYRFEQYNSLEGILSGDLTAFKKLPFDLQLGLLNRYGLVNMDGPNQVKLLSTLQKKSLAEARMLRLRDCLAMKEVFEPILARGFIFWRNSKIKIFSNLIYLDLMRTHIDEALLQTLLKEMNHLESLRLDFIKFTQLRFAHENLKILSLTGTQAISVDLNLPQLETLKVRNVDFGNIILHATPFTLTANSNYVLDCSHSPELIDSALKQIAEILEPRKIRLTHCPNVSFLPFEGAGHKYTPDGDTYTTVGDDVVIKASLNLYRKCVSENFGASENADSRTSTEKQQKDTVGGDAPDRVGFLGIIRELWELASRTDADNREELARLLKAEEAARAKKLGLDSNYMPSMGTEQGGENQFRELKAKEFQEEKLRPAEMVRELQYIMLEVEKVKQAREQAQVRKGEAEEQERQAQVRKGEAEEQERQAQVRKEEERKKREEAEEILSKKLARKAELEEELGKRTQSTDTATRESTLPLDNFDVVGESKDTTLSGRSSLKGSTREQKDSVAGYDGYGLLGHREERVDSVSVEESSVEAVDGKLIEEKDLENAGVPELQS